MTDSRAYPVRPFLAASCAVFRDGRVLLGSRAREPFIDIYSLPGGLVETGETLTQAALRELLEETGVVARIIGLAGYSDVIAHDEAGRARTHYAVMSFACAWESGEAIPGDELPILTWVDPAGVAALKLTPNLAPILERGFAMAKDAA